jgi:hypothetical protein
MRCPRCSSPVGRDQDWCLECGAPARTRLAPTPNWQLPTVALGAIVVIAGALLAFAFVKLTSDDGTAPAGTSPSAVVETSPAAGAAPPAATTTTATTTAPAGATVPSTVPGQTATTGTSPTTATTPSRTTTSSRPATTPSRTTTGNRPATTGTTSSPLPVP